MAANSRVLPEDLTNHYFLWLLFALFKALLRNFYLFIHVPSVNETRDWFLRSPGQEYRLKRRKQGPKASTEFFLG